MRWGTWVENVYMCLRVMSDEVGHLGGKCVYVCEGHI